MEKGLYSGNNVLAMLALLLIVFSVWSFWTTSQYVKITGHSMTDAGRISFCVEPVKPELFFDDPYDSQIISGNFTIRMHSIPINFLSYVNLILKRGSNDESLGNTTTGGGGYLTKIIDTTQFDDANCAYQIHGDANFTSCTTSGDELSGLFSINNYDEEPIWSNFTNNLTTNYSELSSWFALQGPSVGMINQGVIHFYNGSINFDGANLDENFAFGKHYFRIGNIPCVSEFLSTIQPVLTFYNMTYVKPQVLRKGKPCRAASCPPISQTNDTFSFKMKRNGAAVYTLEEGSYVTVDLFDDTDFGAPYFVNQPVTFYANLTDAVNGEAVHGTGVYCMINISYYEDDTFTYMNYNSSSKLYYFTREFSTPNPLGINDQWGVYCNATAVEKEETHWRYSDFEITNRAPVLIETYPNETWQWNQFLTGRDLGLYLADPDGDELNFSIAEEVDNIYIEINQTTDLPEFIPSTDWYGNRTAIFVATDVFGYASSSNDIYLRVLWVPEPEDPQENPSLRTPEQGICEPNWQCGNWSGCKPTGIMTRDCTDLNECDLAIWTPIMLKDCTYIPTCFDHIKNGNETGVDCGGNCPTCPTCFDGIQNQGELGIDCGGMCYPCPTCFDGIKNQGEQLVEIVKTEDGQYLEEVFIVGGEEEVDCGGPCSPCPTCEDSIKNGEEEGIDCGGSECSPCEKEVILERPQMSNAFWSILIISLAIATGVTILVRKKIEDVAGVVTKFFVGLFKKGPETSLVLSWLHPYIGFMDLLNTLPKGEIGLLDLNNVMGKFFSFIYGDYSFVKLSPIVNSYNGFTEELRKKTKKLINSLFLTGTGSPTLIKDSKEVVRGTFIEAFLATGQTLKELFDVSVIHFYTILKTQPELLESMKEELYQLYLRFPATEKGNIYKKIKEIDKVEVRPKKSPKLVVVIVLLALTGVFGVFGPAFTGYVSLDIDLEVQAIPSVEMNVGEFFYYKVLTTGGSKPLQFFDDSEYFTIGRDTGQIRFIPGHHLLGKNFATITVVDNDGTTVNRIFKFTVVQ